MSVILRWIYYGLGKIHKARAQRFTKQSHVLEMILNYLLSTGSVYLQLIG